MSGAPVRPASLAQMVPIAGQVARIERAAAFLANGMSLGRCPDAADDRRRAMPAKMIGNGLRELDLFLTDLIAEAAVALKLETTTEELAHTIHAHPTLPEALLEAAHAAIDKPIHM